MTSALAIRKEIDGEIKVVYASDSLIVKNTDKCFLSNNRKYVEYENFVVLYSGSASVFAVLEDFRDHKSLKARKFMKMSSRLDSHDFYCHVSKRLKSRLEELGGSTDGTDEFSLLIVTKDLLYQVDTAFTMESDKFVTTGSGEVYSLPILVQGYDKVKTLDELKQLAYDSIEISIKLSTMVDYPIVVKELIF